MRKRLLLVALVLLAGMAGCAEKNNVNVEDDTNSTTVDATMLADQLEENGLYRVEVERDNRVCYVYESKDGYAGGAALSCHPMNDSAEVEA